MLSLKQMYEDMTNPLMDDNLVSSLLDCFEKELPIYDILTIWYTTGLGVKENVRINDLEAKDRLFASLFNIWKNNYANISDADIEKNISKFVSELRPRVKQELYSLRRYLRQIPDISTYKEYLSYKSNPLIAKYGWQNVNDFSSFVHVKSNGFVLNGEELKEVEHRLYINPDSKEIENIVWLFTNECFQRNIPFYLKYDPSADRDDALVIYSDTAYLASYIEILKAIREKQPELKVYYPPVLTSQIDNWIGYGSEPNYVDSFHGKRGEVIEAGIESFLIKWAYLHSTTLIEVDNTFTTVQDFIINSTHEIVYEMIKRKYGLNVADSLSSEITVFVSSIINQMNSDKEKAEDGWYMPISANKPIYISKYYFISPYRKLIPFIKKDNPDFIAEVRESVEKMGTKCGIDEKNFAIDVDKKEKMFKYQEEFVQGTRH